MKEYTDALGRGVQLARSPQRIVSLVPSLTEALFAFGLGGRIAGVTHFCVEPPAGVAEKAKVGGTKKVKLAAVHSLEPDLVLANVEENTREDVEAMIAAGLPVFVTYPRTVAGAIEELRLIARITGSEATAAPIVDAAQRELGAAEAANKQRTPVRTFCAIWRNPWMTIGPDTYMHDFLRVCGAENVYGRTPGRYPEVDLSEVAALRPDAILLPDEPYRFTPVHIPEVIGATGIQRIYVVDGKMLCWYGPRIAESLRELQRLLWGDEGV